MEKVGKIYRKSLVDNIKDGVQGNTATMVISYRELSGSNMDTIRKELRGVGAKVVTSRNRLAKIALKDLEQPELADKIKGQTAFIYSSEDSVSLTKQLVKFAKDFEGISIHGGLLDGAALTQDEIQRLAELPAKEVLQAQLLALIISPLTRLAGALNAKSRDLLSILKQLSERKEGGN